MSKKIPFHENIFLHKSVHIFSTFRTFERKFLGKSQIGRCILIFFTSLLFSISQASAPSVLYRIVIIAGRTARVEGIASYHYNSFFFTGYIACFNYNKFMKRCDTTVREQSFIHFCFIASPRRFHSTTNEGVIVTFLNWYLI